MPRKLQADFTIVVGEVNRGKTKSLCLAALGIRHARVSSMLSYGSCCVSTTPEQVMKILLTVFGGKVMHCQVTANVHILDALASMDKRYNHHFYNRCMYRVSAPCYAEPPYIYI